MSAEQQIVVRIAPDGSVEAETKGVKGDACLDSIQLLEDLLEARTVASSFTSEYHETTTRTAAAPEIEENHELRQR